MPPGRLPDGSVAVESDHDRIRQDPPDGMALSGDGLDALVPMHLLVAPGGTILRAGPAMAKVLPDVPLAGASLFDAVKLIKPRKLAAERTLAGSGTQRVQVVIDTNGKPVRLSGLLLPIVVGARHERAYLVALTPGPALPRLMEQFGFTNADVSGADGSSDLVFLVNAQQQLIRDAQDMSARLLAAKHEAEKLSRSDMLTGLPNRRALETHLVRLLSRPAAERRRVALMHLDLDRFKAVNDTLGHAAGDLVLESAARVLGEVIGESGFCARVGGDEFVVVIDAAPDDAAVAELARRICAGLRQPVQYRKQLAEVGASVGIAIVEPEAEIRAERVILDADLALYEVKRQGRGHARFCTPELRRRYEDFHLFAREIEAGLQRGEFVPFFQPQVDGRTGRVIGVEMLARWRHPERGLLLPGQFLHFAEMAGLLERLDIDLRRAALDHYAGWRREGIEIASLGLNLSSAQLRNEDLADQLAWEAEAVGLPVSSLCLEILESVMFEENSAVLTRACAALHAAGFSLSLDDFGTGHAAISTLIHLPVSRVKIDRSFVQGVSRDRRIRALTRSIILMAKSLDIAVLAEGVEEDEDLATMLELGCNDFQGFHFAMPMPAEELSTWVRAAEGRGGQGDLCQVKRTLPI